MKINDISLQLAWENSRHFATPPLQTRTQSLFKCFLGWEKIGIRLRRALGLMGRDVCLHLIPKNHLNSDWVRVYHRWFLREMTCEEQTQKFHTDDVLLPRSEWCFSLIKGNFHPIRSTTRIWVVIRHQHGISALVSQTSFRGKTRSGVQKRRLLCQATVQWVHLNKYMQNCGGECGRSQT